MTRNTTRRLRDYLLPGLASIIGPLLLRILGSTWRVRRTGIHPFSMRRKGESGRYVVAFWHDSLLPLTWLHRGEGAVVLVSRHGDGELIARILKALGYEVARGSSTRGGMRAALELLRYAKTKTEDIGITPDGPKGPTRRAQAGLVFVASRSGFPILPLVAACARRWTVASWDRFQIPKPFSRISVVAGDPIRVPPSIERSEIGEYLAKYESEMHRAEERAREHLSSGW